MRKLPCHNRSQHLPQINFQILIVLVNNRFTNYLTLVNLFARVVQKEDSIIIHLPKPKVKILG
jgi:hypothetical protein